MKEKKQFNILRGFAIFFTLCVIFALLFSFLVVNSVVQPKVLELLAQINQPQSIETLESWSQYGILAACIAGVFQLIFMGCSFSAAKRAIKAGKVRAVQSSVYLNTSTDEKLMKKEARNQRRKESQMKTKEQRLETKRAKLAAKNAKKEEKLAAKEARKHGKKAVVRHEHKVAKEAVKSVVEPKVSAKSSDIDEILKGLK